MTRCITLLAAGVCALALSSTALARRDEVVTARPHATAVAQTAQNAEATIAEAYAREAAGLQAMAEHYRKLAHAYSQPDAKPWMAALVAHCNSVAEKLEAAARDALAIAEGHAKAENAN